MLPSDPPSNGLPEDAADLADLDSVNRRTADRFEVTWSVDCEAADTFLYASITNISQFGIFVRTMEPLSIGTHCQLRFSPPGMGPFALAGQVQWVNPIRALGDNPNPGMGVRFTDLTHDDRERLVEVIRTIAYVRDASS
jgi:type IV pilus assembly protein PilZ